MQSGLVALFLLCLSVIVVSAADRDSNQKFKACCARQRTADKECKRRFCDFRAINQKNLVHYLNMCSPRHDTVQQMWDCASSRVDHTECCKQKKVSPICMPYCEANKRAPSDYLHHLTCLQNFDSIRDCFQDYLNTHPNIFGE
ncbi:unnamed protein product [Auanema sp. JU1783]|nr:unnamed protein product [Auanema sp. JU1783]